LTRATVTKHREASESRPEWAMAPRALGDVGMHRCSRKAEVPRRLAADGDEHARVGSVGREGLLPLTGALAPILIGNGVVASTKRAVAEDQLAIGQNNKCRHTAQCSLLHTRSHTEVRRAIHLLAKPLVWIVWKLARAFQGGSS
jgi:hypothetical protein